MTTLRRRLRLRFGEILHGYHFANAIGEQAANELLNQLTDAAAEILNDKSKIDLAKADPAWRILAGEDLSQEEHDAFKLQKDALDTFERDMRVNDGWNWYAAKTSEDKAWKLLREFVVKTYQENPKAFEAYQTWRTQPYARGAMSNLAIKRNPENFPASWSDFLASSAMYGHKNKQMTLPTTDDNDAPITY